MTAVLDERLRPARPVNERAVSQRARVANSEERTAVAEARATQMTKRGEKKRRGVRFLSLPAPPVWPRSVRYVAVTKDG